MKIAYIIKSLHNSAGMERILTGKATFLADRCRCDVTIFTTDQNGRNNYFELSQNVKCIDLSINFAEMDDWSLAPKIFGYYKKQKLFRDQLSTILKEQKFDIVVSTFGPEMDWLYREKDGSRKIIELHFSIAFRTQQNRRGWWKWLDKYRTCKDKKNASHFDKVVTIAAADTVIGNRQNNAMVIPNFTAITPQIKANLSTKKIIAVGRLSYYKGYDRLIEVWGKIAVPHSDWKLDIYGSGEDFDSINRQINEAGLNNSIRILAPTSNIEHAFLNSSISVLASRHEGFGLVLIEAMACGVPCVAFDCPCGPRDVISDGVDGFLVKDGNIDQMAEKICLLIENEELRREMGASAVQKVTSKFSQEIVMKQWVDLFEALIKK